MNSPESRWNDDLVALIRSALLLELTEKRSARPFAPATARARLLTRARAAPRAAADPQPSDNLFRMLGELKIGLLLPSGYPFSPGFAIATLQAIRTMQAGWLSYRMPVG